MERNRYKEASRLLEKKEDAKEIPLFTASYSSSPPPGPSSPSFPSDASAMSHGVDHISIPINNHLPLVTSQIFPPDQKSKVVMEKPAHCSPFIKGTASSSGMVRSRQMTMWEQARGPSASSMRATRLLSDG